MWILVGFALKTMKHTCKCAIIHSYNIKVIACTKLQKDPSSYDLYFYYWYLNLKNTTVLAFKNALHLKCLITKLFCSRCITLFGLTASNWFRNAWMLQTVYAKVRVKFCLNENIKKNHLKSRYLSFYLRLIFLFPNAGQTPR